MILVSNNPTDPYYTINFGDGSPIGLPTLFAGLSQQIVYTYKTSGVFNVEINVFNKVSSNKASSTVFNFIFSNLKLESTWSKFI